MPLQVAMALSGIERDQWGDFKQLYDSGANVMKKEPSKAGRPRGIGSANSSRRSSPNHSSGIDSMPSTSSIPVTLRDYCVFKVEVMRHGDEEALKILEAFDAAGREPAELAEIKYLEPAEPMQTENQEPDEPVQTKSQEPANPVQTNNQEPVEGVQTTNQEPVEALQTKKQASVKPFNRTPTRPVPKNNQEPYPVRTQLPWTGRDLYDLSSNLIGNNGWLQPAILPDGIRGYFENRSQFSRLSGAYPPCHEEETCEDCGFKSYTYF